MKLHLLIVLLLLLTPFGQAGETNTFYVTDDHYTYVSGSGKRGLNPVKVEAARAARVCQPAKEFPEGNWGLSQLGYQLSLRFAKPVYKKDGPVMAVVLLRNLTNVVLNYRGFYHPMGGPIHFRVTTQSGSQIVERPYYPGYISGSAWSPLLSPGTQHKYTEGKI